LRLATDATSSAHSLSRSAFLRYKTNMKLRHAAALTLVGWYLLAPLPQISPTTHLPTSQADLNVPFRYWMHWSSFDSAKKCEVERQRQIRLYFQNHAKFQKEQSVQQEEAFEKGLDHAENRPTGWNHALHGSYGFGVTSALSAQCIGTDDPRLEDKSAIPPISTW
jgi:hypothetical protein